MAEDVHGLVEMFEKANVIPEIYGELLGNHVDAETYVDTRQLFDVVATNGQTTKRCIQIDVFVLTENHAKEQLRKMAWIRNGTRL